MRLPMTSTILGRRVTYAGARYTVIDFSRTRLLLAGVGWVDAVACSRAK